MTTATRQIIEPKRSFHRRLSLRRSLDSTPSLRSATNSLFQNMLSPPPSPTTGERKQYNNIENGDQDSPPMKRITRPASANSNHYLMSPGSPLKRIGSLSTENILIDSPLIEHNDSESMLMASLPIHANSEMNLMPYSPYAWNNPFHELVSTEESYIHDLMDIVDGYLIVLEEATNSDPTFELDLNVLFSNVRELLNLHLEFLAQLKETEQFKSVAQCFLTRKQQFVSEYTIYCNNYPNACLILKEINVNQNLKILSNFRICQQSLGHMLPLGAYLLKPVQRIMKYPLLIKSMLKKAFTVNYKQFATNGYQEMKEAFECMSQVAEEINLTKRKHELTLHINEIQSMLIGWDGLDLNCYGELILEEQLKIKGYRKERHVFLFEKLFLVAKKEEDVYIHPMYIFVENLMLLETPKEGANFLKVYEHKNPQKYFLLDFSQVSSRKEWVNMLKKLILLSGPAMSENYRKRILEACQTITDDFTQSNEHSTSNKFRDFANITKKRFRKSRAKRSNLTPSLFNPNEVPLALRHSATFSQNTGKSLKTEMNKQKRLSDVTDYDMQYFENEIRHCDSSDISKPSKDPIGKSSLPETIHRFSSSPGCLDNSLLGEDERNKIIKSVSNASISNDLGKKSPARKGAIRRKTNTYLQKKLSETFTTQTEDDFGVKAGLNLRRRHTDKEIEPDILDDLPTLEDLKTPINRPKDLKLENEIFDAENPPESPEYLKIPKEINSERKRSRIMDSESPLDSGSFDFTSPNTSTSSTFNEPSLKLKNNSTLTRNKSSRRAQINKQNSTAKKRLLFDEPFKPDPNFFEKSPVAHLNLYFPESLGELKFSSVHSVDDSFIRKHNYTLDSANKFNTVRSKKSSLKTLFDEKQDSMSIKRFNSLPYSCDVANLFNLFNTSTPVNGRKCQKESEVKKEDIDLSNDLVFEPQSSENSNGEKSFPNETTESLENKEENAIETKPNLDSFVDDEFNYLNLDDSSSNLTKDTSNDDVDISKDIRVDSIENLVEMLENPSKNIPTYPEEQNSVKKSEILNESFERNEIVKTHVLLDGPPSDNSDSDSIKSQNLKNSDPLNSPGFVVESPLEDPEIKISFPEIPQTPNFPEISNSTSTPKSLENSKEFDPSEIDSNLHYRNQHKIPSIETQPLETKHSSNYCTQIIQFVFVGSVTMLVALKVLYEVYYNR